MPRPRAFDEDAAVVAAAGVFTARGYEGASVDDLVTALGIHRGSLYRTFGSKLGLFHRALRDHVQRELLPWIAGSPAPLAEGVGDGAPDPGLLLVAAVERASDPVVTGELERVLVALARSTGSEGAGADALTAGLLGLWVLARAGTDRARLIAAATTLQHATDR